MSIAVNISFVFSLVPRGLVWFDVAFAYFSDTIFRNPTNVWEHREESEDATKGGLVSRRSTPVKEYQQFVKALGQQPLAYFIASSAVNNSDHASRIFFAKEVLSLSSPAKFINFASVQK